MPTILVACHCRVWDLSLERDEEEEAEFKVKTQEQVNAPTDIPPQLLFVHQVYLLSNLLIRMYVIYLQGVW